MSDFTDMIAVGGRFAEEAERLRAANARLTKMLELAARDRIGFRESTWMGKTRYRPLVCGSLLSMVDKMYDTPIEALEAAFEEWENQPNVFCTCYPVPT